MMKLPLTILTVFATLWGWCATRPQDEYKSLKAEVANPTEQVKGTLWIEAEGFAEYGDWVIDTQFTHKMGSAYLMCPGLGEAKVRDAQTRVIIPRTGEWSVWARTRDWVPEFHPGRFQIVVDGQSSKVLGESGLTGWHWEKVGRFHLSAGPIEMTLKDLSGAFARCDAIILTEDADYIPPDEENVLLKERLRLSGIQTQIKDGGKFDFIVVGAGSGGTGAAVAAARLGVRVAMVFDRPIPGGNCSRECGIGLDGAQMCQSGSRECGLPEELRMRGHLRGGSPGFGFEEAIAAETNITTFVNQRVMKVEKDGNRITAVLARDTTNGKWTRYRARLFADATGDGWVAYFAGARTMYGREDRQTFGEDWTVEKADILTMSGSIMGGCMGLRIKKLPEGKIRGEYHAPVWAKVLPRPFWRPQKHPGSDWWMENPGRLDDLDDPEGARDNLIRIAFDYWDWQCNDWEYKEMTQNHVLDKVPWMNARREGMRVVGDYILNGNDCISERVFEDAVATGGWSCDVHDPLGMENPKSDGWNLCHKGGKGPYTVPYRMLYSADIANLFLSSRCFSMSHIALGSMRVSGTIMSCGQAVGTAAAFCLKRGMMPREYGQKHIDELRHRLFRDDLNIQWLKDDNPENLALIAKASDLGLNDGLGVPKWKKGAKLDQYNGWKSSDNVATLEWDRPVKVSEINIAFDTGLKSRRLASPMPRELVRDYVLEIRVADEWQQLAAVSNNQWRYCRHTLPTTEISALRITCTKTWGDKFNRILEIRVY